MTKYLNNSIKRSSTSHILNDISNFIICVSLIVLLLIYIKEQLPTNDTKALEYIELKHSYKNCIIVGKSERNEQYILHLRNPFMNNNNFVDYNVRVKDYVFFNFYIGDTIK